MRLIRVLLLLGLSGLNAQLGAGEILILQPAVSSSTDRNQRQSQELQERARQQAGQPVPDRYFILDQGAAADSGNREQAERLLRDARGMSEPGSDVAPYEGGVILRAVPVSEAERLRLKARSYATEPVKPTRRDCSAASNQIGMVGEGAGAMQSPSVVDKGGSAVNPNCR